MTYATPPGPRIAYDKDGSLAFYSTNYGETHVNEFPQSALRLLNSDGPNMLGLRIGQWYPWPSGGINTSFANPWIAIRFPVAMRMRALAYSMWWTGGNFQADPLHSVVETSSDSTNGADGTWVPIHSKGNTQDFGGLSTYVISSLGQMPPGQSPFFISQASYPSAEAPWPQQDINNPPTGSTYETFMQSVWSTRRGEFNVDGYGWHPVFGDGTRQVMWLRVRVTAKGTKVYNGTGVDQRPSFKLHLYGEPDTTADDQRVSFVTPASDPKLFFDFGDIDYTDSLTQTFRVKNESSTLTAEGTTVQILPANPTMTLPSPDAWCKLSIDGISWVDELELDPIAPDGTSDIITLRVEPEPGINGPWSPRLQAVVEEWT